MAVWLRWWTENASALHQLASLAGLSKPSEYRVSPGSPEWLTRCLTPATVHKTCSRQMKLWEQKNNMTPSRSRSEGGASTACAWSNRECASYNLWRQHQQHAVHHTQAHFEQLNWNLRGDCPSTIVCTLWHACSWSCSCPPWCSWSCSDYSVMCHDWPSITRISLVTSRAPDEIP